MNYDDIRRWCRSEMRAPVDSDMHRRAKAILAAIDAAIDAASAPPWLAEAAAALGEVRHDGSPLTLNWTQVITAIRGLRKDRDAWRLRALENSGEEK